MELFDEKSCRATTCSSTREAMDEPAGEVGMRDEAGDEDELEDELALLFVGCER